MILFLLNFVILIAICKNNYNDEGWNGIQMSLGSNSVKISGYPHFPELRESFMFSYKNKKIIIRASEKLHSFNTVTNQKHLPPKTFFISLGVITIIF